jgi:hypothetical protein
MTDHRRGSEVEELEEENHEIVEEKESVEGEGELKTCDRGANLTTVQDGSAAGEG